MPDGYTPTEMVLLARSSLPAHRVAALRMLAALLAASRPTPSGEVPGAPVRCIPLPLTEPTPPPQPPLSPTALPPAPAPPVPPPVPWTRLWTYLVTELGVASHLRLALDDSHAPVVHAALCALAALVCPGPEEEAVVEVADCCPRLGWPCVWSRPLQRAHGAGTWEGEEVAPSPSQGPGARQAQQQAAEGEEERTPEDVGAADPLAGVLQMQVGVWGGGGSVCRGLGMEPVG